MIALCAFEASNELRGTDIYAKNLIHALAENDTDHQYVIFTNNANAYQAVLKNPNFQIHSIHIEPKSISSVNSRTNLGLSPDVLWLHTDMFALANQYQVKLIHVLGYVGPQYKRKDCSARIIVTAHGLEHEVVPQLFREDMVRFLKKSMPTACQNADHIIAVSHCTKNDLQEYYQLENKKITVVNHGVSDVFRKSIEERPINNPYILYVGSSEERKNFHTVLKGFYIFKKKNADSNLKLVVAGGNFDVFKDEIHRMKLTDEIITWGMVKNNALAGLYRYALAFVTLSYYEGFGLVAAESLASSVPLIASNIPAFKEVVNSAGVLIDPEDSEAFATTLLKILEDESFYRELKNQAILKQNQFTIRKMALETKEVYTMMLN